MTGRSDIGEELESARQRTLAASSARIVVVHEWTLEMPAMLERHRSGLMRPLLKAGKAVGKALWAHLPGSWDFRRQEAEGVIDLARRRFMLDYDSYARLFADGQEWVGRSGRLLFHAASAASRHRQPDQSTLAA